MKRRYLKKVASAVDAPGDEKREYLRIVEEDVDDFLADVPDATPEELEDTLGTPEELSDAYLEATPVEQVSKKLKKARSVKGIVIAAVCSAIALFAIMILLAFVIVRTNLFHLKTGDDSAGMHPRASNGYVDTKAFPPPFTYMAAQSGGKDEGAEFFAGKAAAFLKTRAAGVQRKDFLRSQADCRRNQKSPKALCIQGFRAF